MNKKSGAGLLVATVLLMNTLYCWSLGGETEVVRRPPPSQAAVVVVGRAATLSATQDTPLLTTLSAHSKLLLGRSDATFLKSPVGAEGFYNFRDAEYAVGVSTRSDSCPPFGSPRRGESFNVPQGYG